MTPLLALDRERLLQVHFLIFFCVDRTGVHPSHPDGLAHFASSRKATSSSSPKEDTAALSCVQALASCKKHVTNDPGCLGTPAGHREAYELRKTFQTHDNNFLHMKLQNRWTTA